MGRSIWDHGAEMEVRTGTKHEVKRVLSAAVWGVLPPPLWLATHGWEVEVVCNMCGRTCDLRHAVVGCGGDEAKEAQAWQQAFGEMDEADIVAMTIQSKYLGQEDIVQELRNGAGSTSEPSGPQERPL